MDIKRRLRTFTMAFALIAIWFIFNWVTDGAFLQARNLSNLFRQMAITGILASGMVFVIVAGHVDLSVGSVVAFVGAVLALLTTNHGTDPTLAFFAAVGLGGIIGLVQGTLVSYQRIPAFIVTLGGMMAFRGLSMWVTTGNTIPLGDNWIQSVGSAYVSRPLGWIIAAITLGAVIFGLVQTRFSRIKHQISVPSHLIFAGQLLSYAALVVAFVLVMQSYQGIPVPVLIMLALMVVFFVLATRTTFGRRIYAVGGGLEAARYSGINVRLNTLVVFILMGIVSGIGAVMLTARVGSASPDAGQLLELDAIAACVIGGTSLMGGRGTIFGAILGAAVMESLNNGMSLANMEAYWQYIIKGLVLVAAVWADTLSQERK